MARPRKKLKILLIEPNYSNKYPPIGLMKLSTYHKMLGHEVVFYKGDLKQFVIERIANNVFFIVSFYFEFDVAKLRSFHLHVNRKKYI